MSTDIFGQLGCHKHEQNGTQGKQMAGGTNQGGGVGAGQGSVELRNSLLPVLAVVDGSGVAGFDDALLFRLQIYSGMGGLIRGRLRQPIGIITYQLQL